MDRDEIAARRLAAGQPLLCVHNKMVYLVPNGFEQMGLNDDGTLVVSDGCGTLTIGAIGRVRGGDARR